MAKILALYDSPSLLVGSIVKQLTDCGHQVVSGVLSVSFINENGNDIDTMLVFADEDLDDNTDSLIFIKDKAIEGDFKIFAIGDENEIVKFEKIIPKNLVAKIFHRPVNVKDVVTGVDSYVKTENRAAKKKILVVDDSGAMLRNVKGWLEDKYQVVLANSGAMAIKYLSVDKPDLVLLDYEMPVVDGKQVFQMIRSEIEFSDVPVIFLTSKGDRESVLEVMKLRPEGYLLKTLAPSEIVATIDNFFLKKRVQES